MNRRGKKRERIGLEKKERTNRPKKKERINSPRKERRMNIPRKEGNDEQAEKRRENEQTWKRREKWTNEKKRDIEVVGGMDRPGKEERKCDQENVLMNMPWKKRYRKGREKKKR